MALAKHFSERPYATGSLIGHRAFTAYAGGLYGPRFPQPFGAGVNQARCITQEMGTAIVGLGIESLWAQMKPACVEQGCACGFYAYTHPDGREFESPTRMNAIIEGFGKCVVGPLGFRCGKARLLALVMPHLRGENDPYGEMWGSMGQVVPGVMARQLAHNYRVPLFDNYVEAYKEFPPTEEKSA